MIEPKDIQWKYLDTVVLPSGFYLVRSGPEEWPQVIELSTDGMTKLPDHGKQCYGPLRDEAEALDWVRRIETARKEFDRLMTEPIR